MLWICAIACAGTKSKAMDLLSCVADQNDDEFIKDSARSEVPCELSNYMLLVASSYLLLVVRPGAPSSVLAPSSDALCY